MACTSASAAYLLQNAVNRFSGDPDIGFNPIGVDCVIGTETASATFYALTSIANLADGSGGSNDLLAATAQGYIANLNTPADIAADAANIAQLIDAGANALSQPSVPPPVIASSPNRALVPRSTRPPLSPTALAKINKLNSFLGLGLPSWTPYVGGTALAIGALMMIAKRMKNRGRLR